MINKMIDEINKALDEKLYLCALSLALTIPDICGKAEFPDDKPTIRYKKWFDEHIGYTEKPPKKDEKELDLPHLSGEVLYQLRCSLFHQGSTDVDIDRIKAPENKLTKFTLTINQNRDDFYGGSSSMSYSNLDEIHSRTLEISVQDICNKLCWVSKSYYEKNKEKFNFIQYDFFDWGKEMKKVEPYIK